MFRLGELNLYWYSFFLALGVVLCYLRLKKVYRREGLPQDELESLMLYSIIGMFAGARLGYACLYQPGLFLAHPVELVKMWRPGLSSHGAAVGLLAVVFIWSRIRRRNFFVIMSLLSLGLPLILACARIGNFINSEAVGVPTGGDWGVVFLRLGETLPRHPAQLYELLLAIAVFLLLNWIYRRSAASDGQLLFLFGLVYFSGRIVIEFWKPEEAFAGSELVSLPQLLSLPPVLLALGYFVWTGLSKIRH